MSIAGSKVGRKGGPNTSTEAQARAEQPLYRVLREIGTKAQSLKPEQLITYDGLLEAEAVASRVSDNATRLERAEAAGDAIRDAIAAIDEAKEKLIAEAALATREPFIGTLVKERRAQIEDQVSYDDYKKLRPRVIGKIAAYLEKSPESLVRSGAANPSEVALLEHIRYNAAGVQRDALRIAYYGMAMLFIAQVEKDRGEADSDIPYLKARFMAAGMRPLFEALLLFKATITFSLIEQQTMFRLWVDQDSRRGDWLIETAEQICTLCPLGDPSQTSLGEKFGADAVHPDELYLSVWKDWFRANWTITPDRTSGIELLASKAGAFAHLLGRRTGASSIGRDNLRLDAWYTIQNHYDTSALLYERFFTFCDTDGLLLVKNELP